MKISPLLCRGLPPVLLHCRSLAEAQAQSNSSNPPQRRIARVCVCSRALLLQSLYRSLIFLPTVLLFDCRNSSNTPLSSWQDPASAFPATPEPTPPSKVVCAVSRVLLYRCTLASDRSTEWECNINHTLLHVSSEFWQPLASINQRLTWAKP